MTENWRPISDWPDYEVSDKGRVRSLKFGRLKMLRLVNAGAGYLRVSLCAKGKCKRHYVHGLVAEAFLGSCPEGHEVNHKDGIKHHNDATNLEWVTHAENLAHAEQMGLANHPCGERNGMSKLTTAQVIEMRRLHALGKKQYELGKRFGVSCVTVSLIVRLERWRHVAA